MTDSFSVYALSMFLALVLLLGRSDPSEAASANVNYDGPVAAIVNGDGSVRWRAAGRELPLAPNLMRGAGPSDCVIAIPAGTAGGPPPSVAFAKGIEILPARINTSAMGGETIVAGILPATSLAGEPPLRVGLASGNWETVGKLVLDHGKMGERTGQGFVRMVRPEDVFSGKRRVPTVVVDTAMPTDLLRSAYEVRLVGSDGRLFAPAKSSSGPDSLRFLGDFSNAVGVELRQRTYQWTTVPKS